MMNRQFNQLLAVLALCISMCATGCQLTKPYRLLDDSEAPVYPSQPRELQKVTMPDYTIEPPDLLTIEAVNLIPKAPYVLRPLDAIVIETSGLPEARPLAGEFVVGIDGTITLGAGYDEVEGNYEPLQIAGLTIPQAQQKIRDRLALVAAAPVVWMQLISIADLQDIAGEHLVAPDGTVTLGSYGRVRIVGMTVEQAKVQIEAFLSTRFENPEVAVDVFGYNSKVYYVVLQGAGLGDRVVPLPVTGNDTALDAISQLEGLSGATSTVMWIARPGTNSHNGDQILPIDWPGITQRGDVSTNYQLMPGDRLFIAEDKLVAFDTALGKLISPIERVFGVTLLGTSATQRIKFFNNQNFNNANNNF